jgi:galactose mutarotase-like enzyme
VNRCDWEITSSGREMKFFTAQRTDPFHYELQRSVQLDGRTLVSSSELTNQGQEPLVLEWFAHPFFALSDGCIQMETPAGTRMKENPGFVLAGRTFSQRRKFLNEMDGHLDFLELPTAASNRFRLNHPKLTHVDFSFDFAPSECLVWGNDATFSVEPYLSLSLSPGESRRWNLHYDFGAVSRMVSPGERARTPDRV